MVTLYPGEDLDVVADLDEVHLLVKLKDMDTRARATSVKDHGVLPWRRHQLGLLENDAGLPSEHCVGEGRAGERGDQEEEEEPLRFFKEV